ncbi:MAG: hypothetical protein NTX50_13945 [Candidatus Sumerlaeota bacterium]|nr:hypothetical protein [Candidatus Sumerlaeota bacterium]
MMQIRKTPSRRQWQGAVLVIAAAFWALPIGSLQAQTQPVAAMTTLSVRSNNPNVGAYMVISPEDINHQGSGFTPLTLTYYADAVVSVTAATSASGNFFQYWLADGVINNSISLLVAMNVSHTLIAIYQTPPAVTTPTLTVESGNASMNISVSVNPADADGKSSGITPLALQYAEDTLVKLTAPVITGNNAQFIKWQKDHADFDGGATATAQVVMNTDHILTAYYFEPTTITISGVISGIDPSRPSTVTLQLMDMSGNQVKTLYLQNGSYSFVVPDGFSGWLTPSAPGYTFKPINQNFLNMTASAQQDFLATSIAEGDISKDYTIIFKQDGNRADSALADLLITTRSIEVLHPGPAGKDTLMIKLSPEVKNLKRVPTPIRSVTSSGGFGYLYTQGDINELTTSKTITRLTAFQAVVASIVTSGGVGLVQMSARPTPLDVEYVTKINADDKTFRKASLALNGIRLGTLTAPKQEFSSIVLASKMFTLPGRIRKVQMSGLIGAAGGARDVDIYKAASITAKGASITPFIISGGIKKLSATGLILNGRLRPGDIKVYSFQSTEDGVSIIADGGKIYGGGYYLVNGRIASISARYKAGLLDNGGINLTGCLGDEPTSGALLTTSYASGVDKSPSLGILVVASGLDTSMPSDIAEIVAQQSLHAVFLAGAERVFSDLYEFRLMPKYTGRTLRIKSKAAITADSVARIYASKDAKPSQRARVTPLTAAKKITVFYNDVNSKEVGK